MIGSGGLFCKRSGPDVALHVVIVACIAEVGLIKCLCVAHLANSIAAMSSIGKSATLTHQTIAQITFDQLFAILLDHCWQFVILHSNLY